MWSKQEHFGTGQASARAQARFELDAFSAMARKMQNIIIAELGSVFRRYGSFFLTSTKSNNLARLELVRIGDTPFMAEITLNNIRVLDGVGTIVVDTAGVPWLEADFDAIYAGEIGGTMLWITHESYSPRIIRRTADGVWSVGTLPLDLNQPVIDNRPKVSVMSTTDTLADGISIDRDHFQAIDAVTYYRVGKIKDTPARGAWAEVTTVESRRNVKIDVANMAATVALQVNRSTTDWVGPFGPAGATITGTQTWPASGSGVEGLTITWATGAHGLDASNVGDLIDIKQDIPNTVIVLVRKILTATTLEVDVIKSVGVQSAGTDSKLLPLNARDSDGSRMAIHGTLTPGSTVTLYSNDPIFNALHIAGGGEQGAIFFLNDGCAEATAFASKNEISAVVKAKFNHGQPTQEWAQGYSRFSGFPSCVAEHQSRTVLAGYNEFPSNIGSSGTSEFRRFFINGESDGGLLWRLSADRNSRITWLKSAGDLLIGTKENEHAMRGQPITPSNVGVDLQHSHGGAGVAPAQVGTYVLFATRCACQVREMVFREERQKYLAPEMTIFSRDLFDRADPITQLTHMKEPEPLVFARKSNNDVQCLTYRRDDESGVVGWTTWTTKAVSVQVFPAATTDEVWMVVPRNVSGPVHYIERIHPDAVLDSQIDKTADGAGVITGLGHLNGLLVEVRSAGGVWLGTATPVAGSITIAAAAGLACNIGIGFEFKLIAMPQEVQTRDKGWSTGLRRSYEEVKLYLNASIGGKIGGDDLLPAPDVGDSPTAFSGWLQQAGLDANTTGPDVSADASGSDVRYFEIIQSLPFPFEVLALNVMDQGFGD